MSATKDSTFNDVKEKAKVKEPKKYVVVLYNDDYTPMDFVVAILVNVFNKTPEQAYAITMQIHHQQKGIAGIYTYEIAENKVHEVSTLAREHRHPLTCKMEPA